MPDGRHSDSDVLSPDGEAHAGMPFVPSQAGSSSVAVDDPAQAVGTAEQEPEAATASAPWARWRSRVARVPAPWWRAAALAMALAVGVPLVVAYQARAQWEATTVRLPEGLVGLPRDSGGQVETLLGSLPAQERLESYQAGLYGNGSGQTLFIIAARTTEPLSAGEQAEARREFVADVADRAGELTLHEKDAGRLGGYFGCGEARGVTTCLGTNRASMVAVLVLKPNGDPVATALAAREATVRRH